MAYGRHRYRQSGGCHGCWPESGQSAGAACGPGVHDPGPRPDGDAFRGDATLNHLRIGNYIGLRDLFHGQATTNKEISEALGIPTSTVSRIVTELMKRGYVTESLHPEDQRVRLLRIVPNHPLAQGFESEMRALLHDVLSHHGGAGKRG